MEGGAFTECLSLRLCSLNSESPLGNVRSRYGHVLCSGPLVRQRIQIAALVKWWLDRGKRDTFWLSFQNK